MWSCCGRYACQDHVLWKTFEGMMGNLLAELYVGVAFKDGLNNFFEKYANIHYDFVKKLRMKLIMDLACCQNCGETILLNDFGYWRQIYLKDHDQENVTDIVHKFRKHD